MKTGFKLFLSYQQLVIFIYKFCNEVESIKDLSLLFKYFSADFLFVLFAYIFLKILEEINKYLKNEKKYFT